MNGMKTNLNIYFSSICNMSCAYCAMQDNYNAEENEAIRQAIIDGSFQQHVITKCQELQPVTLGIWGMEPSINQDLWGQFITPILQSCNSIKGIFLSTNGLAFDAAIWYAPLYAIQRKIKLWIQWRIDGPSCDQTIIDNLYNSIRAYQDNNLFRVKFSIKSTLQAQDLRTNVVAWNDFMNTIQATCNNYATEHCDVSLVGQSPTLERPGNYTKEDGIYWGLWTHGLDFNECHTLPMGCAAGKTSWTIDYQGVIYDCPLKKNRIEPLIDFQTFYNYIKDNFLNYQIRPYYSWYRIYRIIMANWCWATSSIEDLNSYIKVWCNGAIQ